MYSMFHMNIAVMDEKKLKSIEIRALKRPATLMQMAVPVEVTCSIRRQSEVNS